MSDQGIRNPGVFGVRSTPSIGGKSVDFFFKKWGILGFLKKKLGDFGYSKKKLGDFGYSKKNWGIFGHSKIGGK